MTTPLTDEILTAIALRDDAAGDGLVILDTSAALDRHLLLMEVRRLRDINTRIRQGRPVA